MKIKVVTKFDSGYLCGDPEGVGSIMWRLYPHYNNGDDFTQNECDEIVKEIEQYVTNGAKENVVSVEVVD